MLLSQIRLPSGEIVVAVREPGGDAKMVKNADSVYALAMEAANTGKPLVSVIQERGLGDVIDLEQAYSEGRFLPPITHPDAGHLHLTGTGLTHLGSAATRDSMHKHAAVADETLTDSMKMFNMGLENGKSEAGKEGVQPEWFYKGNGHVVAAPGAPLISPSFALDSGEEPEMAGIYVISDDGTLHRIGFALSNEFSDHVMERINYLYLAHSKLRPASFGPEIRIGVAPEDIRGTSRIRRGDKVIFEKPFLSGETNMSHSFANLEHHHFKYGVFRVPGDIYVHMFGTATLSFADGIKAEEGDMFEIEVPEFGLALRNPLTMASSEDVAIKQL